MQTVSTFRRADVASRLGYCNSCLPSHILQQRRSTRTQAVKAEGDVPSLNRPPVRLAPAPKPVEQPSTSVATAAPPAPAAPQLINANFVTTEYQRQRAKEMLKYFKDAKLEETVQKSKVFGWTKANEITNGRWVMFGFATGLLTEYATGVDFINQLKLLVSYLGIADIYD